MKKDFDLIGSRIAGGNSAAGRKTSDFYPTPPEATIALLNFLSLPTETVVWECACGSGKMSRAIEEYGYKTISSDKKYYGYGKPNIDFLTCNQKEKFDWIITNPPFSIAEEFIKRAWSFEKPFAFLLKSQFWNVARRIPLFEECTPTYILPLTWRPDFTGAGGALMDMIWTVWERRNASETKFLILKKPAKNF